MQVWPQIDHHPDWDCCWLTILCRARKAQTSFDWGKLKPILFVKAREHFDLPAVKGKKLKSAGMPVHYSRLLPPQQFDARSICAHKLAKLLYLEALRGPLIMIQPSTTTPPHVPGAILTEFPGFNVGGEVATGTTDVISFLQSLRPYFQPSNAGPWSSHLAYFVSTFISEISRHVGKQLCYHLKPSPCPNVFESSMHASTVKFLCGSLLILIIEGLYGKNMITMQFAMANLKNLASLFPELVDIVFPLLLQALGESAVSQSHQAPAAMNTISITFRMFMYPRPVAVAYLPELLRLSLDGIDPNDPMKTTIALNMYSHIFHWLPIKSNYALLEDTTEFPSSYFEKVTGSGEKKCMDSFSGAYGALGQAVEVWADAFLEKIFMLAEKREVPRKSGNSQHSMNIGASISETVEVFFSAVDDEMHARATSKVLEFLRSSLPMNAAKELASMLASIVASRPSTLPVIVDTLLDRDILTNQCSPDKLAFRLRLLGGAMRRAGAAAIPMLSQIRPLLANASSHTEKTSEKTITVRKALCKLLKDCLRGLVSFYPLPLAPVTYEGSIGTPNNSTNAQVPWYIPESDAMEISAEILKETVSSSMDAVSETFRLLGTASSEESTGSNVKETEESLVSHLKVILRGIQGAAEILGDCSSMDSKVEDRKGANTEKTDSILETGRSELSCKESTKIYIETLRFSVLKFLISTNNCLDDCKDDSHLGILRSSTGVRVSLLNIYYTVILGRMASLKHVDKDKKWFNMDKRISRSLITKYMLQHSKGFDERKHEMQQDSYWRCHDMPLYHFSNRARLQFAKRQKEFSFVAVRIWGEVINHIYMRFYFKRCSTLYFQVRNSVNGPDKEFSSVYLQGLNQLISICGHDYDSIRQEAVGVFNAVSMCFGWRITDIIKPVLGHISTAGTSYAEASGAFSILTQPRIMKRILGQWELTSLFLQSVEGTVKMLAAVEESDKREILLNRLTHAFSNYVCHFHHQAFVPGKIMPIHPLFIADCYRNSSYMLVLLR